MKHTISTQMTKKAIADSLKKLMAKKPIGKISIREIIEDCGVNRQTFYYHFRDIYDLVEWTFNYELLDLMKQYESSLTYEEALRVALEYIKKNESICRCALDSIGVTHLHRLFYKGWCGMLRNIVRELAEGLMIPDEYIEFISMFYTEALVGMTLDWLNRGLQESIDTLIKHTNYTLRGNIRQSLERVAKGESTFPKL